MVTAAKSTFGTSEGLVASIDIPQDAHGRVQWAIRHLIEPSDQEEPPSELRRLEDWNWLAPQLLSAVSLAPALVLGAAARVVGNTEQFFRRQAVAERFRLSPDRIERLFGEQRPNILRAFVDAPPTEDWILRTAQTQAAKLLAGESIEEREDTDDSSRR
jgi:hypothetical protein